MEHVPFHVVLVHPEIPPNTGNIGRLCVGTGCMLHLVEPLGFDLSASARKRAGLDYWDKLAYLRHENVEAFLDWAGDRRLFGASTHAKASYARASYTVGDCLLFGSETQGLPQAVKDHCQLIKIPRTEGVRSYNLANATAVVLMEALRQNDFPGLT